MDAITTNERSRKVPLVCRFTFDIYKHIVTACAGFSHERERFILYISNNISADISRFLSHTDLESLYCSLLGGRQHMNLECDDTIYDQFLCSAITFVSQLVRRYPSLYHNVLAEAIGFLPYLLHSTRQSAISI